MKYKIEVEATPEEVAELMQKIMSAMANTVVNNTPTISNNIDWSKLIWSIPKNHTEK